MVAKLGAKPRSNPYPRWAFDSAKPEDINVCNQEIERTFQERNMPEAKGSWAQNPQAQAAPQKTLDNRRHSQTHIRPKLTQGSRGFGKGSWL